MDWKISIYREDDPEQNRLLDDAITCKDDVFTIIAELTDRYTRPTHDKISGWASGSSGAHIRYITPDGIEYMVEAMPMQQ